MATLANQLKERNRRLEYFLENLGNPTITKEAIDNFERVLNEGRAICELMNYVENVGLLLRGRIQIYLIASENAISAIGLQLPEEYCGVINALEFFDFERRLIMMFLDGELSEEMFSSTVEVSVF